MLQRGEVAVSREVAEALGFRAELRTVSSGGRVRYLVDAVLSEPDRVIRSTITPSMRPSPDSGSSPTSTSGSSCGFRVSWRSCAMWLPFSSDSRASTT